PLPYAEAGYGFPESGQTVLNVTNGKIIRLLVDDEPFDVRYGRLLAHERALDLRDGALRRHVEWESPAGTTVRVRSTRLVSFATDLAAGERLTMVKFLSYGWSSQRSLAAIRDQVIAAVAKAKYAGWDSLLEGQRAYLDDFWTSADVELEGDTELQQAVRFALF